MFTGLIEEIGTLKRIEQKNGGKVFEISANFSQELKIGESVAINGACQSVISKTQNTFSVFSMLESLKRTNLNYLKINDSVNLERAMILGIFKFEYDTKYIVEKGSIAINGISLTVSEVGDGYFCVSTIPQTLERTNLKFLKTGDFVNIEVDIFAKYIEKFLSAKDNKKEKISLEFLMENGFN